jgi:hypothetical protein
MSAEIIEHLLRPQAYPHAVDRVELIRTHISLVFLAGERVYKVKKPVNLGFVDYSTPAQRLRFCREEVRLNRRLAPHIYLGVVPITRSPDGWLQIGGDGPAIEFAVEMVRLPAERMMDRLLERGEVDNEQMNGVAGLLADFHARAATGPGVDEYGSLNCVRFNVEENFEQTRPFVDSLLSPKLHEGLAASAERFLDQHAELFDSRVQAGRIRDGHGDLHSGNICFTPEGIVVYDCIEFTPRFRCGDVAADLAFLAMDLDRRGFRGFASYLAHRYAQHAGDPDLALLLPFYKGYRAMVRAKVAALRSSSQDLGEEERNEARTEAMRYFHLAASYELPPTLLLMCGLPGTGKSWIARRLARALDAVVLRSDAVRKLLAGLSPLERAGAGFQQGIYSAEHSARTYARLLEEARSHLSEGRRVIVDASFSKRAQREPFLDAAQRLALPWAVLEVTCPESIVQARMDRRAAEPAEASDADFEVYLRARDSFEPPLEVPSSRRLNAASEEPIEELTGRLLDRLLCGGTPEPETGPNSNRPESRTTQRRPA